MKDLLACLNYLTATRLERIGAKWFGTRRVIKGAGGYLVAVNEWRGKMYYHSHAKMLVEDETD